MPTFDPDVANFIELGRKAGRPPYEAMTPEEARAAYAASWDRGRVTGLARSPNRPPQEPS